MRIACTLTLSLALGATPLHGQKVNPEQMLEDAAAAEQAGDSNSAIRDYLAVIQARPTSTAAHVSLGAIYEKKGQYDSALEQYEAALPHVKQTQQRQDLLLALGQAYYKKGDLADAKSRFQSVVNLQTSKKVAPATVDALTMLATCDLKLNEPAAALAAIQPHAGLSDTNPELAHVYGFAMIRTGKLHDGAQMLFRVADLNNDAELYFLAGSIFLEDADYDGARQSLENARRLDPRLAGIHSRLGIARLHTGDTYAADSAFREALRLDPDDFLANLYLGVLLLEKNAPQAAEPFLLHAQKLKPSVPPALAENKLPPGTPELLQPAIDLLNKAPVSPAAHTELAALYDLLDRPQEASTERSLAARQ